MPTERTERQRIIDFVQTRLRRHGLARIEMTIVVMATGLVGFLFSAVLLWVGVSSMAVRYGLAVVGAYAVFLLFVRLWVELHRRDLELDDTLLNLIPEPSDVGLGSGGDFGGGGASGGDFGGGGASGRFDAAQAANDSTGVDASSSGGGLADVLDIDDAWIVVVPIVMFVGGLVASVLLIWSAPALLAEVVVDVVLVSALYRRLANIRRGSWLATAVRKTWVPVTILAVLLIIGGLLLQLAVPGAESVGEVFNQL